MNESERLHNENLRLFKELEEGNKKLSKLLNEMDEKLKETLELSEVEVKKAKCIEKFFEARLSNGKLSGKVEVIVEGSPGESELSEIMEVIFERMPETIMYSYKK
jgi:hypothetical protein